MRRPIKASLYIGPVIVVALAVACSARSNTPAPTAAQATIQPQLSVAEVCELLREKIEAAGTTQAQPLERIDQGALMRQAVASRILSGQCKPSFDSGTWTIAVDRETFSLREATRIITAVSASAGAVLVAP